MIRQNSPGQGSFSPMTRGFFILGLFLLCFFKAHAVTLDELISKAKEKQLSQSAQWLNLLHYKKTFLGGMKSQADGEEFFLSPEGKTEPEPELQAYLQALFSEKTYESDGWHPACRFPARYFFLKKELEIPDSFFKWKCEKLEEFKKNFSPQAVSLVFSGYFINTPASTFGHTLLRFKRKTAQGKIGNELLDHASNYAATVTTNNAFLYGVLGMTGGFKGEFAALPYFYKIREYNDYESRDLWDYELNLKPDEIEMMLLHLWEMSSTYFDYFYLTENCSYHILGLIDVARPGLRLQERTPYIVIPADTIKVVSETPGLLSKVSYRPSKRKAFIWQVSQMTQAEKKNLLSLLGKKTVVSLDKKLKPESQGKVLDAAMDYLDFRYAKEILIENSPSMNFKNELSEARSELGIVSPEQIVPTPPKDAPHLGHGSRRIGVGAGEASNTGRFEQISYRFSLHDFLDTPTGHNKHSTLEMGSFTFRYNEKVKYEGNKSKLWFEDFSLVNVVSLSPWDRFFKDFSWRAYFGVKTIREKNYRNYFAPAPSLAGGISRTHRNLSYFLFMGTELVIHSKVAHEGYRPALGPEAGLFYNLSDRVILGLKGSYQYRLFGTDHSYYRWGAESRVPLSKSISFDVSYERLPRDWEMLGKFFFYY